MDTQEQSGAFQIPGFEMLERLGEGGTAFVWKARQISLDRIVAVKVLSAQFKQDAADVQRFQSEAQQTAKLKNVGIVQVYDAGVENGIYYIVMEYVAGYTVGDWIRRKGALGESESLQVCEHVAKALEYAWQNAGIIHCDIKPDNVIIDSDGSVKVADLGLSRTIKSMSASVADGDIMGTPAYIAPEQFMGVPDLDCRADIYSLGAMLYQMVTGKPLFEGHPDALIMEMQVSDTVPNARDVNPKISIHLCTLIERMLAKNRDARYRDWSAVRADMVRIRNRGMLIRHAIEGGSTMRSPSRPKPSVIPPQVTVEPQKPGLPLPVISVVVVVMVAVASVVLTSQSRKQVRVMPPPRAVSPRVQPRAVQPPHNTTAVRSAVPKAQRNPVTEGVVPPPPTLQEEAADRRKQAALEDARRRQSLLAENKMSNLLERLTLELTADGVGPALLAVHDASEDQDLALKRETINTVKGLLEDAANMDARIIEGFIADQGREIKVHLTSGVTQLTIVGVKDGKVSCLKAMKTGSSVFTVPLTFEARDLAVREKIARMGSEDSPPVALIKGLFAWQAKAYPHARRFFACTHPLLADRLVACVVAAEAKQVEDATREVAPQIVAQDVAEPEVLPANDVPIKPAALSAQLAALEGKTDAIRDFLLDRNPGLLTRECSFTADTAGKVYRAEIWSGNLVNIGGLAAFRDLKELVCGTRGGVNKLADLSALRGLPLEYLYVESARVQDLSFLRGMALKRIAIVNCPLTDLSPLKDMTSLEELLLRGTEIKDLSPLKGLKIRRLDLASTRVFDLRPLSDLPLEHLDISNSQIKDITVLRTMPLRSLNLARSRVFNFSALKGLPLTSLNVEGTQFRDLRLLTGMPLKSLAIGNIDVTDLASLKGHQLVELSLVGCKARDYAVLKDMPMRILNMNGSKVEDLAFVNNMPLDNLDISNTKIADLSPLKGRPLKSLQINNSQVRDLRPIEGMALTFLSCQNVPVRNFDPLNKMPLTSIVMDGPTEAARKILRTMPNLKYVNGREYER